MSLKIFFMKPFLNQNHQTRKKEKTKTIEKDGNLHGRSIQMTTWWTVFVLMSIPKNLVLLKIKHQRMRI